MSASMPEQKRLKEDRLRTKNWKRWGPYLSERQWATVREDYSVSGDCWTYFPHEHARSRAYRWGEDGLLGITDRQCRVCLSPALWNGQDPFLKERLFGLTGHQGNHGEDVKELYYYLDSTPTHSYMKALYKYPQTAYPYEPLIKVNAKRSVYDEEYELLDTGVIDEGYWDVLAEFGKGSPNDILAVYTVTNHGPDTATLHILPTLWMRNTWSWGPGCDSYMEEKPQLVQVAQGKVLIKHSALGDMIFEVDAGPDGKMPEILFTENDSNMERLWEIPNSQPYVKDAFHDYVCDGVKEAVNPEKVGTKCAAHYILTVASEESVTLKVRLYHHLEKPKVMTFGSGFDEVMQARKDEADAFYEELIGYKSHAEQVVARQAYAGLLWSKQFYHYVVQEWLKGDSKQPKPPRERLGGRNHTWEHLFNRDIISMPDKWEYPWYASWDLAFHMIPMANIDLHFAKEQLMLFLREWYMHPNGQIPAYEFAFGDVNPPVHAYAVLKVYKASGTKDHRDVLFLARCFHKLVINFTWWVNRKDPDGKNIFEGGFLGLDNIGVFDRSKPLPIGGRLDQADGTAWMAFFCVIMLEISLILARRDPIYEDMASKFFEHFVFILDAMNNVAGEGLWDDNDGFFYDHIRGNNVSIPLKIRSMVGMVPLFSSMVLRQSEMKRHPGFYKRTTWFLEHKKDLASRIVQRGTDDDNGNGSGEDTLMLTVVTRDQLVRILHVLLDEDEFLSPYGIRSLSKYHAKNPFKFEVGQQTYCVDYQPGESTSKLFGGNSNWRGPIWLPMNYLLIENLQRFDYFYQDTLKVECPTRSGKFMRLREVASELSARLSRLFLPDPYGSRACHGHEERYAKDPAFKDLVLFYEYFNAENGKGYGASHQTGWTALIVNLLRSAHHRKSLAGDSTSSLCGMMYSKYG